MKTIRVVAHVHSKWSYDGSWSLPDLASAFARRGYDAVLMAEHDRGFDQATWDDYREACTRASTARILLVPGIEYSDPSNSIHVPVWGEIPFLGASMETDLLLGRVQRAGGFAVLAHPGRSQALHKLDPALLANLNGLELWNRKYDGYAPNREVAELLRQRPGLLAMVSLDFHTARQFHPLAMLLETDGPVSEAAVYNALRHGRSQATAFGLAAQRFAQHPAWPAIHYLERSRKRAAKHARAVRRLRCGRVS